VRTVTHTSVVLPGVEVCPSVLQHVAACCSVLQCCSMHQMDDSSVYTLAGSLAVCCSVLQYVAALQHIPGR